MGGRTDGPVPGVRDHHLPRDYGCGWKGRRGFASLVRCGTLDGHHEGADLERDEDASAGGMGECRPQCAINGEDAAVVALPCTRSGFIEIGA